MCEIVEGIEQNRRLFLRKRNFSPLVRAVAACSASLAVALNAAGVAKPLRSNASPTD